MRIKSFLVAAFGVAVLAGCATMAAAPIKTAGGVLTGDNGMTLYTFDRDTAGSGKSVCNGPCATNWPPLLVDSADAIIPGVNLPGTIGTTDPWSNIAY